MAQRDTVQGPCEWYLIASRGVGAVRVRPGMLIGETAEGELSFDPSCAQVELGVADDGDLMLNAVGDNELESTENGRCSEERVPRHRRAEVHLQNNVLRLNTDFLDPTLADDAVEIRTIAATPDTAAPHLGWFAEGLAGDTADAMAAPPPGPRPAGPPLRNDTWGGGSAIHRQQFLGVVMLALAGLVVLVGFALLYPSLQDVDEPLPTTVAGSESIGPDPATTGTITRAAPAEPEPTTARSRQGAGVLPATVPQPTLSPAPGPRATRPGSDDIVVRRGEGAPESSGLVIAPIPLPTVAHRSMPEVTGPRASEPAPPTEQNRPEPQVTQTSPPPATLPPPVTVDRRPNPALVAELERIGAAASRMTAEMARDRDLRAADLALAQGQLTTPPDASAYLLYSRVLEVDPGSTEAARGLQSVRQGLINRAMAQIAGNTLDDARRSLQAAEQAGANPMLVADLLAEVDYRQRAVSSEPDGSIR